MANVTKRKNDYTISEDKVKQKLEKMNLDKKIIEFIEGCLKEK